MPTDVSTSLQWEPLQVHMTESLFHPFSQHHMGCRGTCSLPPLMLLQWCSASLPVLQFGRHQPILPLHWDNFLQITLETKQQRCDCFSFPCQKPYVPCQDVTHNTLHYRHTSFMLTQKRDTFTASSHVISSLMHWGKASVLC